MYALNLLQHMRAMSESMKRLGGGHKVDFSTLALEISHEGRYFELTPLFAHHGKSNDNSLTYEKTLTPEVFMFAGWRPGEPVQCEIKRDKLAFKKFCVEHGLRTPALVERDSGFRGLVLVKERTLGGFRGLHYGPILAVQARDGEFRSAGRNFMEEFITGGPLQAWYWNGQLACIEIQPRPAMVMGDGITKIRELVEWQCPPYLSVDWQIVEAMVRAQGESMTTVLARGRELAVDFRWQTPLRTNSPRSENVLEKLAGTPILDQLTAAGPIFLQGFPRESRDQLLFRVDGVIDRDETVWFTSLDPDRYVHPDVYPLMVRSLLHDPARAAVLANIQASLAETKH